MRHLLASLCLCALACGSNQPESPMSPRPSAQQTESTASPPQPTQTAEPGMPQPSDEPSMQPQTPGTPRTPALDASAPQMQPPSTPSQPMAATPNTSCKADSDCEAIDDMCGMCRCLALAKGSPRPACQEPKVQCVMAPCRGKRAVCKSGTCAILDASSGAM